MPRRDMVLRTPVRTVIGTFNGTLQTAPAPPLGAAVARAVVARLGRSGAPMVMRHMIRAGTKMNPARQATIGGGVPVAVPAMTVNRVCGSGAQAIVAAARTGSDRRCAAPDRTGRP